ncbi:MAG: hypothetical protein ABSB12_03440 [Candidatus Saccharimonadales bacterium]
MGQSIQIQSYDDKGRPYYLLPVQQKLSGYFEGLPEYDSPPPEVLMADADKQLALIHHYEDAEGLPRKAIRKVIDWALSGPGTIATGAVGAYEAYSHHLGGPGEAEVWISTFGVGIGGLMVHEFFRRPFVGARAIYHAWRNPFKPAAQSNERIRQKILEL